MKTIIEILESVRQFSLFVGFRAFVLSWLKKKTATKTLRHEIHTKENTIMTKLSLKKGNLSYTHPGTYEFGFHFFQHRAFRKYLKSNGVLDVKHPKTNGVLGEKCLKSKGVGKNVYLCKKKR